MLTGRFRAPGLLLLGCRPAPRDICPRTVMRYVKPGDEAVAEVTSLLGPPARDRNFMRGSGPVPP
jgi:hypothetical protein